MSHVLLTLDTHAPVLAIEADTRIAPGEAWEVVVRSNEPLSDLDVYVTDSLGDSREIGWVKQDDRTVLVLIGTTGLPTGPVEVTIVARDMVCNEARAVVEATLVRESVYDVDLDVLGYRRVVVAMARRYSVSLSTQGALVPLLLREERYEVDTASQGRYDVSLEVSGG